jgi:3-hydroxyacyl-CoA dehydrogenase/enoyl-CoA hydratase/carnithine racemase
MALDTKFTLTYYDSPSAGRLALLTMDNGADHRKPTTLGQGAMASLEAALDAIASQPDIKGLLLTGKPFVFAAGADLDAFAGAGLSFAREAARRGHAAFSRLRDLTIPTLAAINGACLGGGLEIALHCDCRTVSTGAGAIGFPEVYLSIVPAWGGTQLAPRIAGTANALQVIVHNALNGNRTLRPADAVRLGLADRLIPAVDLLDASLSLLERLVTGEETIDRKPPDQDADGGGDIDRALAAARAAAAERTHGATPAPSVAIDLIEFAARGGDLAEGLRREEDALAALLPSRQAQASVYSFGLTQRVKRQPGRPEVPPRPIRRVGIAGAGLMGAQLGALLLHRLEVPLVLKDVDQGVLDRARATVDGVLAQRVARGRMSPGKARFLSSIVTCTCEYEPLAGADLVLEATVERMDLKQRVFAELEQVVDPGCVLATNTSSLTVGAIAAGLEHPQRVVALHFFNPVAVLPLVEIARGRHSSDEAVSTAFEVAKRLGKSAVLCADTPAFVVNRLLARFIGACVAMASRGADFTEVDDAIEALGLPMGPFALLGLVGPPTAAHVARTLHLTWPDRFPLDPNLEMLGESGLPGVYDPKAGRIPYAEITERWQVDADPHKPSAEEIRAAALEAVADEARHMLDDATVADARDIDTCMLLGAGWPFFMGGICAYLDQMGISQRLHGRPLTSLGR